VIFKNLSSKEEMNKWIKESTAECKVTYFMPASYEKYPVAVDIGANVGGFCINAHNKFDKIYAFEPLIENYVVLEQVIKQFKLNNVEIFHNAVYSEGGKKLILKSHKNNISGNVTCIDTEDDDFVDLKQACETVTLDDIFKILNIDKINYLKMDCEGSEYDILENFSNFDKICLMGIEIHSHYGEERRTNLLQKLSEHYHLHACIPLRVPSDITITLDMKEIIQNSKRDFESKKACSNWLCINKKVYQPLMEEDNAS